MTRLPGRAPIAIALLATIAWASTSASAGIEDTVGLGPRAMALGGAVSTQPGTFAGAYYNPAGLAPAGSAREGALFEGTAALVYGHAALHATRADGGAIATPRPADTAGLLLGARFSIGHAFGVDGLDGGVALYLPPHLFRWSIRPDDDPQWALLGDRTQVISANVGLAWRLAPWISIGVGARVLFDVQTNTTGQVTSVRLETDPTTGKSVVKTGTTLGTDAQVFGRVSPLAGVLFTPARGLRLAVVWRHEMHVDDWGSTRISGVPDLGDMGYSHYFAHYFEPTALVFGASVDAGRLTLSGDVTVSRWSGALSTNRNGFGAGRWGDTLTPAVGAELRATRALSILGGYRYQRSPVQNFGGPTNLLDCDRHVGSLGVELALGPLVGSRSIDARVTLALAYTVLAEQTETKDFRRFTSDDAMLKNPGYPSFTYGGHTIAAQAGVEARF